MEQSGRAEATIPGPATLEQTSDTPLSAESESRSQRSVRSSRAFGDVCIVCLQAPADKAHLVDRSLASDEFEDPLRVVRLCRKHHDEYDSHTLDLLPYLGVRHRPEIARAVEVHPAGILGALERITGHRWRPC